jgi:hypothetical protein
MKLRMVHIRERANYLISLRKLKADQIMDLAKKFRA